MSTRDPLAALDEMIDQLVALVHQHRGHPERIRVVQRELDELVRLKIATMPPPSLQVQRNDHLQPEDAFTVDGVMVFGRFAYSRLMRPVHAPWPEHPLEPDQDFGRDTPPA